MMTAQLTRQINILNREECATVRRSIHELQPLWDEERCRLGAGISYYKPQAIYYATAKRMNPILQKHFGWLYDKLREDLAVEFNAPVNFREDLALPGFNIYCGSSNLKLSYNIHVDMQYQDLNWDPPGSADFESTMSFTLPIANPTNGSGLNIWNVTKLTDEQMTQTKALAQEKAQYQRYELGIATIHDGKHYHQMCIAEDWNSEDERITLQGHGLMQNGSLVIYG